MFRLTGNARKDYAGLSAEYLKLRDLHVSDQETIKSQSKTIKCLRKNIEDLNKKHNDTVAEKDAIINELKVRLANAEARLNHDGTNTGSPTSQTKPGKPKVIPNSRRSTGKKKGGQPGHPKHSLKPPPDNEITDIVEHVPESCRCGCKDLEPTGEVEEKCSIDVEIKVKKTKHLYGTYKCKRCGKVIRCKIDPKLKEKVQYGNDMQAVILSLINSGNMAINKVASFMKGITVGELAPSEGFIAKLQKRGAKALNPFMKALRTRLIGLGLIYWDDTVVFVNTKQSCLRFYGDEDIAFYAAHEHKDLDGIMDDNILPLLPPETTVMHDHNSINYHEKFCFNNIECNQHLQRDCQRNSDDTGHSWSTDLKSLISTTIKDRKDAIEAGLSSFNPEYLKRFEDKLDEIIALGWTQYKADNPDEDQQPQAKRKKRRKSAKSCAAAFERALLTRLGEYRKNYFLWVEKFEFPTTNNVSYYAVFPITQFFPQMAA